MKRTPTFCAIIATFLSFYGTPQLAKCETSTDPERVPGADAIDPKGMIIDEWIPEGAASLETLAQLPSFMVIQDFTPFNPGDNVIRFTDPSVPDVFIEFGGESLAEGSGASFENSDFATSGSSAIRFEGNRTSPPAAITMRIEFGKFDPASEKFVAATDSKFAPTAVAFTFAGRGDRTYMIETLEAIFKGPDGNTLSMQSVGNFDMLDDKKRRAGYFGYGGEAGPVGSVEITLIKKNTQGAWSPSLGIDDIGFAVAE